MTHSTGRADTALVFKGPDAPTWSSAHKATSTHTGTQALLGLATAAALLAPSAATAHEFATAPDPASKNAWVCQYDTDRQRAWMLRCENLTRALAYDEPVDQIDSVARMCVIPLWGTPYSADGPLSLARAVLCGDGDGCAVELASR